MLRRPLSSYRNGYGRASQQYRMPYGCGVTDAGTAGRLTIDLLLHVLTDCSVSLSFADKPFLTASRRVPGDKAGGFPPEMRAVPVAASWRRARGHALASSDAVLTRIRRIAC